VQLWCTGTSLDLRQTDAENCIVWTCHLILLSQTSTVGTSSGEVQICLNLVRFTEIAYTLGYKGMPTVNGFYLQHWFMLSLGAQVTQAR
jgi:hypothetical protein